LVVHRYLFAIIRYHFDCSIPTKREIEPERVQYVYASDDKEAVVVEKVPSLAGQLIFSTLVMVFGNVLFGLLALIIARTFLIIAPTNIRKNNGFL